MDREYIELRVKELGEWYQIIDLDGVMTRKFDKWSGVGLWPKIESFLPDDLTGKRILDLGSNAGYNSVQAANLGAEVTGIEIDPKYIAQAKFVKEFFEDKYQKPLNINYINMDISDVESLGKFDYVFAIAILYHIGTHKYGKFTKKAYKEQKIMIDKLSNVSNDFIVRTMKMNYRTTEYFNTMFEKNGFKITGLIDETERQLVYFKR